jgi:hypothetical protein
MSRRRPLVFTLEVDTSGVDEAMRRLQDAVRESARVIGEQIAEGMRPFLERVGFLAWLQRSGQNLCGADHEFLVGRCPACKAST